MRDKKLYYNTIHAAKKIIVEHYCRKCGICYCRRWAKAFEFEKSPLQYHGYCCVNCAETVDDIAPVLREINRIKYVPAKIKKLRPKNKIIKNGKVYNI